jgi:galactofuranosylgalactofuranosylrhamnosyl-N-acetylglucosaminyl-diphospho-decaprenol beta-1,5/1,6-galactofuranosyltransferase
MSVVKPLQALGQAAAAYPLQQVIAPRPGAPSQLYFAATGATPQVSGDGPMQLASGQQAIADGFFNCFYLSWWARYTDIDTVGLICHATGRLALRVIGHREGGERVTLLDCLVPGDDAKSGAPHWAWDRDSAPGILRLHVEVTALDACTIDELSFVTLSPPRREVSLSVGICTFNREDLLAETMAELLPLLETEPALRRIILVNQGQPFSHPTLTALHKTAGLEVIRQPNRGGCGGFARTMIETLDADEPVTHHLIMDDDIRLDARVVQRAVRFLGYCTHEVALGGQSIDLEDRLRLHEAGAMVGKDWAFHPFGKGRSLANRKSLEIWNTSFEVDYNGWWFCVLPVAAIRQAGLPAPFFLHNDDVDYGLRLKKAGIPLVPLPGLGVWHASFLYKHAGLVIYYDLRNLLIMASFHPGFARRPGILTVLGWTMFNVLVHRYRAGLSCLIAIEDYLAGPDVTFAIHGGQRNRIVRDRVHALPAPEVRTDAGAKVLPVVQPSPSTIGIAGQVVAFAAIFLRIVLLPNAREPAFVFRGRPEPLAIRGRPYLLALDPAAARCLHLRPHRLTLIRLTARALILALRYGLQGKRAAARWQAAMPALCSRERWAEEFSPTRD